MKKHGFIITMGFLALILAISATVMLLWNWLLPPVLGVVCITFWQALGIFVLCRILFGGFGLRRHFGHHHKHFHALHEKWHKMSPEQREKFFKKHGCGHDWHAHPEPQKED
jgi:hypothetical protein